MDIMYWTFPHLSGKWSVAAGRSNTLQNGVMCLDVRWDNGYPFIGEGHDAIFGTRWRGDAAVQAGDTYRLGMQATPVLNTEVPGAKKFDGDKPMMDLLFDGCPDALLKVGDVLTYGFKKYGGKHGWKSLPDAQARYKAAMIRHELALSRGEVSDPESGLPHAAHIACNALFLLQFHEEPKNAT